MPVKGYCSISTGAHHLKMMSPPRVGLAMGIVYEGCLGGDIVPESVPESAPKSGRRPQFSGGEWP
ncbi:UNVERIFIED_CONTAM: hypothetical protein Sangu_0180200 [Sesamum angustifolium]|uniref:Uncharacterized protein n=1 Tax=Sesamum angustifolium TaxID=2727405 RepID=A0AAW2RM59_9LAMI